MSVVANASSSPEEQVEAFLVDLVQTDPLQESFNLFLVHRNDSESEKGKKLEWLELLKRLQAQAQAAEPGATGGQQHGQTDSALRALVQAMARQRNPSRLRSLSELLVGAVGERVVTARQACDALLGCDALRPDNQLFWVCAFSAVRRVIGGVDYKGVREVMKACVEKVSALPSELDPSFAPQLKAARELLEYIFDRNAALLPGYFVVNEILKSYPENPSWPHPALVPLVSSFLNSFRPTAQMVTSLYRHRMRPVVESAGKAHAVTAWKLDPNSLKFLLKGSTTYERILPYARDIVEPQQELLRYVLRQPYSKEMVNSMLGLQKPNKKDSDGGWVRTPQYQTLGEELVHVFVAVLKETPELSPETRQALWATLASELIFFILFQYIGFGGFVDRLAEEVGKLPKIVRSGVGRDHLMWALLQYVSGSIGKNAITEFACVLKLYRTMYWERSPLPTPEVDNSGAVRALAGAAILFILRNKARQSSEEIKEDGAVALQQLHGRLAPPPALTAHAGFLHRLASGDVDLVASVHTDFRIPVLCNTYSTCQEVFQPLMTAVYKAIGASVDVQETTQLPGGGSGDGSPNSLAQAPTEPLSMDFLDSLTVHAKMSLVHSVVQFIVKQVSSGATLAIAPAVVESFCRILVYTEIESLGLKSFLNQLLPQVFKLGAWRELHMLLEIFSFRLHHIQPHFRLTMLNHLQVGLGGGANAAITKNAQLNLCLESTSLRLITGLGNAEMNPGKSTSLGGAAGQAGQAGKAGGAGGAASVPQVGSHVTHGDSEELNRVVVLSLARAIHINGMEQQSAQWVKETLAAVMQRTPHSWPTHTLENFPPILQEFFKDNPGPRENKPALKQKVEEEYRTWSGVTAATTASKLDLVQHFANPNNTLFLCVLWKTLLDNVDNQGRPFLPDSFKPFVCKILDRIGSKQLALHLRSFCDVLVCEFSKSGGSGHVNKCIEAMNSLIWKYNVISLDRLILCMVLRTNEGNEAQVCFFIIQLLLLKPQEFRMRVSELVRTMSPEHQVLRDFHKCHLEFHQKFPERFSPLEDPELAKLVDPGSSSPTSFQTMPVYFGNVCLRFIPVFDIVVHRFLELPPVTKSLETLLDHVGVLYKFHDRPISYLYNTLFYYERRLRDRPSLKKKLVSSITGALKEVRPAGWCLTEDYLKKYLEREEEGGNGAGGVGVSTPPSAGLAGNGNGNGSAGNGDGSWTPDAVYYLRLVGRLARALQGRRPFPHMDWRFSEFPNEGSHALYVSCVEVMALPSKDPAEVTSQLLDVVLERGHLVPSDELPDWINVCGLLLSNLPEAYWEGLSRRLVSAVSSPPLSQWAAATSGATAGFSPFRAFSPEGARASAGAGVFFGGNSSSSSNTSLGLLLALAHATYHHCGFGQIQTLPDLVRERLLPCVKTEEQLLFVFHLAGPFLQRLHSERLMRPLFDLTVQFYRMLQRVDRECSSNGKGMQYLDPICDILYHVKYQFTGDSVRQDAERIVRELSSPLQLRLRFIAPGIQQQQNQS